MLLRLLVLLVCLRTVFVRSYLITNKDSIYGVHAMNMGFGTAVSLNSLGTSVAISTGDNNGNIYIYTNTNSNWYQTYKLDSTNGIQNVQCLDWDSEYNVIATGSPSNQKVALYVLSNGQWKSVNALNPPNMDPSYGKAVSANNNMVAVGSDASVYVYRQSSNNTWTQVGNTINAPTDCTISSVMINGNTMVIGVAKKGIVNVYKYINNTWTLSSQLNGTTTSFGTSVACSDQTIIVGSPGESLGAAYIYNLSANISQRITASDETNGNQFGYFVDISYDKVALIGAPFRKVGYNVVGGGYVFVLDSSTQKWIQHEIINVSSTYNMDVLGKLGSIVWTPQGYTAMMGLPQEGFYGSVLEFDVECSVGSSSVYCNTSSCLKGTVSDGMWGTGKCIFCNSGWAGPSCNIPCNCTNGICSEGISGNGKCFTCNSSLLVSICNLSCGCITGNCTAGTCFDCIPGYYGKNCEHSCSCVTQCSDGINGNGTCAPCPDSFYGNGSVCLPCTCKNGLCMNGPQGNGNCRICYSGFWGRDCEKKSNCVNGVPDTAVTGAGECVTCFPQYFGINCNSLCTCSNNSDCNDGITGDGSCQNCTPGYFGKNCDEECMCQNGICNDGITGDGRCQNCTPGYFGQYCDGVCMCQNGTCNDGITGNGSCIPPKNNYTEPSGSECESSHNCQQICISKSLSPYPVPYICTCSRGYLLTKDLVSCTACPSEADCDDNSITINQTETTLDQNLAINSISIYGSKVTSSNSLTVSGDVNVLSSSNLLVTNDSNFTIDGNFSLCNSTLCVVSGGIIEFKGNVSLINGNLNLSSICQIKLSYCANFTGSNLTVVLDKTSTNDQEIPLISYSKECPPTSFSNLNLQSEQNSDDCKKVSSVEQIRSSLSLGLKILYDDSNCNTENIPWIWILVGCLLGVIILAIAFVMVVKNYKPFRKEVLPFREAPPEFMAPSQS